MSDIDKFSSILRQSNVSVTKPRIAIFQTLQSLTVPVKSGEIARLTPSVDRASFEPTTTTSLVLTVVNLKASKIQRSKMYYS